MRPAREAGVSSDMLLASVTVRPCKATLLLSACDPPAKRYDLQANTPIAKQPDGKRRDLTVTFFCGGIGIRNVHDIIP